MKKITLILGFLLTILSITYSQTTVYWRTNGPSDGKWDWGTNCEGYNTDGQWYYNSWGGNRQRPDCYGNHDIYFDGNGINTMDLNSVNDFGVRRIFFTVNATTARTLNTSASRTLWLNSNNGNPKIENNSTATHTFNVPVSMTANTELNPVAGSLVFNSTITNGGYWTDVWGSSGTSLTIAGGLSGTGGLTVKNNTTVNMTSACAYTGDTYVDNGVLVISGDNSSTLITVASGATLRINGNDVDIQSLTINSGGAVEVLAGKSLTVNGTLTNNGTLTLKSNSPDGTATIITPATMSGTGTYNVEQYLSAARNWYISSPVTNAQAPTDYTYYKYDETGGNTGYSAPETAYWTDFASGTSLIPGLGFIALPTSASTITFTTQANGKLNSGEVPITLTRSGALKTGFNLIGNPFPCHLGWTYAFVNANSSLIESSIWIRTNGGTTNNSGQWSFATFNASSSEAVPSVANAGIIPPMQAFWVRAKTGGTLTLNSNLTKTHQTSNPLKAPAINTNLRKKLRLQVTNGTSTDELLIYSDENALNTYDDFDSPKLSSSSEVIPELYTVAGSEQLVINGMQSIPLDTEIPLGFRTQENAQTFVVKATEFSGFDANVKVYIRDHQNLLNPETELTSETNYSFTSDATDNTTRLSVIFKSAGAVTGCNLADNNKIAIFADNNKHITINIGSGVDKPYSLMVYNALGQKIVENQTTNSVFTLNKDLESGVYFVKIDIDGKQTTSKVVIR